MCPPVATNPVPTIRMVNWSSGAGTTVAIATIESRTLAMKSGRDCIKYLSGVIQAQHGERNNQKTGAEQPPEMTEKCNWRGERPSLPILVGVLAAEPAALQDNLAAGRLVAEPPTTKAKPPLAIVGGNALEFLDVVVPRSVHWIGAENGNRTLLDGGEVWMLAQELPRAALVVRGGADKK